MTRSINKIAALFLAATILQTCTSCSRQVKTECTRNFRAHAMEYAKTESKVEEETTSQTTSLTTSKTTTQTTTVTTTTEPEETYISLDELQIDFNMDVSIPTGLSKEDFVYLINNIPCDSNGYFSRNAEVFWEYCNEYGVNEIFACAITAWESGWGQIAGWGKNNYFGISGGSYETEADGVKGLVTLLAKNYLAEDGPCNNGCTITGVSYCYCEPDEWPLRVYDCMLTIVDSK